MRHLFLVMIVGLVIQGIFPQAVAQTTPDIQNLQNLNVDELTDEQIQKFIQQVEASGYTEQQLELLARARGMSSTQIQKLRERIAEVRSGQLGTGESGAAPGGGRLREQPGLGQDTQLGQDKGTTFDPFAIVYPEDTLAEEDQPEIFGLSFFRNENLTFQPSLNVATPKGYRIGPGDQIIIDVWGASEQTYQLDVSPEGMINIPSIGPIYLNGLTMEQAEARIKARLKSIYSTLGENTFAQISLGQIRTIKVNVIGEVMQPGTYTMSSFANAFNALYSAGGPSESGSLRDIQVFRAGQRVASLDAYDFLVYGRGENVMLQDQDVVIVKPYRNRVTILGEVKRPAIYETLDGETLAKLLEFCGGFTEDAYTQKLSVRRNQANSKTVLTTMNDQYDQFALESGDFIDVAPIANRFVDRVRIEGAVNYPGEFGLEAGMMLSDLVALADGYRGDAFLGRGVIIRQNEDFTLSSIAFDPKAVLSGDYDLALQNEDLVKIKSIFDLKEDYTITIQGEVLSPGKYPYVESMTVEDLIYLADGFKETAARSFVEVARRVNDQTGSASSASEIFNFAIDESLELSKEASDFVLKPFDLVVIRKSPFYEEQVMVEIEGEVKYPGKYALEKKDERISDVLKRAGGLSQYAYARGATLIRRTEYYVSEDQEGDEAAKIRRQELQALFKRDTLVQADQEAFKTQEPIGIRLEEILKDPGSKYDLILKEGDVISIPRELQTVRIRGEVLYPSTVRYDTQHSFKDFISQAGGFTDDAKPGKAYVINPNGSAERTRGFLWFRNYPKVEPGAEIIIPSKPERRRLSPGEIISLAGGLGTLALVIDRLVN